MWVIAQHLLWLYVMFQKSMETSAEDETPVRWDKTGWKKIIIIIQGNMKALYVRIS